MVSGTDGLGNHLLKASLNPEKAIGNCRVMHVSSQSLSQFDEKFNGLYEDYYI